MRPARFRSLPHPADVGVEATGPDLAAALDQAVRGLAALLTGGAGVSLPDAQPVRVEAPDLPALVVGLLEECLFRLEARGWLAGAAEVRLAAPGVLEGVLRGETFDPAVHGGGTPVKAVTYHQIRVVEDGAGARIRVFFDV